MIVQAIALLDDLDKEINIYSMRVKVSRSFAFRRSVADSCCRNGTDGTSPRWPRSSTTTSPTPRSSKPWVRPHILVEGIEIDNRCAGFRTNYATTDFSSILPEELEETLKAAAAISMGTEISESDLIHIHLLTDQVISITQYRAELYEYLRNRMAAIAPNLTALVGELVGARLIAHAGSLLNLAKHPASTVQILGAEKALFRALKTKHDTPKYGLIFHASLVGQAPQKLKGKVSLSPFLLHRAGD